MQPKWFYHLGESGSGGISEVFENMGNRKMTWRELVEPTRKEIDDQGDKIEDYE